MYPNPFDTVRITSLARGTPHEQKWCTLLRFVEDGEFVDKLVRAYLDTVDFQFDATSRLTTDQESAILQATTFFKTIDPALVIRHGARFLLRGEAEKHRNRLLTWTALLNEAVLQSPEYVSIQSSIRDTLEAAQQLRPKMFAKAMDIDKAFFGFKIHPMIQLHAATQLTHSNCTVVPTRLPMGYRPAAELCSLALIIITEAATKNVPDVTTFVHVDNVRLASTNRKSTKAAKRNFLAICNSIGMKCSDTDAKTFLGMQTNYRTACVNLNAKQLRRIRDATYDALQSAPFRTFYTAFCRLLHMSRLLRFPIATIYPIIKFVRKRLSTLPTADSATNLWSSLKPIWNKWTTLLLANNTTRHHPNTYKDFPMTLFTDASTRGWGAVLISPDGVIECQGRWQQAHTSKDIAYLEIQAIARALQHFLTTNVTLSKHLLIAVDSTTASHVIVKGHSASYACNKALIEVQSLLHQHAITDIAMAYIHTSANPADYLSRFDLTRLRRSAAVVTPLPPALERLGREVAEGQRCVRLPETAYSLRSRG